jgi:hypothetical protein
MELNKKIDNVLKSFNFERVQKVLVALEWSMLVDDCGEIIHKIPTVQELIFVAKDIVEQAFDKKISISTAGFEAIYCVEDADVYLKFVVETSLNCY